MRHAASLLAVVALVACGSATAGGTGQASPPAGPSPAQSVPVVPAHCVARGQLPDPSCTPGAVYTLVTQANIHQTICVKGWTATIRPPVTYTEPLKRRLMTAYGIPKTASLRGYEMDHLIPLELGGDPTSVDNLWPEPGASPNTKDTVESVGREAVCRKTNPLPLTTAQVAIAKDWVAFGKSLGVKVP